MKNWKMRAAAASLAVMLCLSPASYALADETEDLESQLEDLQRQAEEQQAHTDKLSERIGTVSEQLRVLSADVKEAEADYNAIANELEATEMRIEENQELLEETELELADKQAQLRGRIRNVYMHGQISYIDVLFGAKDFSDFLTRMDLLKRVVQSDYALVKEVRAAMEQIESTRVVLEEEREQQL